MNEKEFGEHIERIRKLLTKGTPTPAKVMLAGLNKEFAKHRAIAPAFLEAARSVPLKREDKSVTFAYEKDFLAKASVDQAREALRHMESQSEAILKVLNEVSASTS